MADGLWQRVRLILDRRSAEEVKRESQEALKEGTDPKAAERNLDRVESRFQRVRRAAAALGAAIVAAFTVRMIGRFLSESFQAAEALRTSRIRLQQALRNESVEWERVEGQISAVTRALWDSHRLTEGEVTPTLQALVTITGDYEQSLRGVGIAADLAAATNMDVQSAARLVGRVMNGEITALRRYGITIEEGSDAVQVLEDRLRGMALAATPPTVVLTKAWGDFKESIGEVLIVGGDTDSILGRITETIRGMTDSVNENRGRIGEWVGGIVTAVSIVGRVVGFVLGGIRMAAETVGTLFGALSVQIPIWIRGAMLGVQRAVLETLEFLAKPLRALGVTVGQDFMDSARAGVKSRQAALKRELEVAQQAARDAFADISAPRPGPSRDPTEPPPSFTSPAPTAGPESAEAKKRREEIEKLIEALEGERDALRFSRWELIERSDAYRNASPLQQQMVRDTFAEIEALNAHAEAKKKAKEAREEAARVAEAEARTVRDGILALEEERDSLTLTSMELLRKSEAYLLASAAQQAYMEDLLRSNEAIREQQKELQELERAADRAGHRLTRSFGSFFDAMHDGFGSSAQLMEGFVDAALGVGAAVVGALAEGQVDYHRAQGVAKLAEGTWPPNPAAIASSLQHFAAAAAFAALPGLIGGARGFGGGAAGQIGGARAPDVTRSGDQRPIGPDIIIRIDGVDPKNPRHQQLVGETDRQYRERYGGRIRVEGA